MTAPPTGTLPLYQSSSHYFDKDKQPEQIHRLHSVLESQTTEPTYAQRPTRHSINFAQDVVIPASLLQAAGIAASVRNLESSANWEPQATSDACELTRKRLSGGILQRQIEYPARPGRLLRRRNTAPNRNRTPSPRPSNAHEQRRGTQTTQPFATSTSDAINTAGYGRQISYTKGSQDHLTVNCYFDQYNSTVNRDSEQSYSLNASHFSNPFEFQESYVSRPPNQSSQSNINPFEFHESYVPRPPNQSSQSNINPFETTKSSVNTRRSSITTPEAVHAHLGRSRKGTLTMMADALVPNTVQRTLRNASVTLRRTSLWETLESAKKRGVRLQRNKYVQWIFEYAIYMLFILFVYFVLVGDPLWHGAVYWLWWIVAKKLVLAGGCSITLGIALL
jgi:hypothetical protein